MDDVKFRKVKADDGHIAVAPMPTQEELSRFYADLYFQDRPTSTYQEQYSEDELAHRRLRADLMMHAVNVARGRDANPGEMLLEVGVGEGFLLASAARAGYSVLGIDFTDHAIKRFHPGLVEKLQVGDSYQLLDALDTEGSQYAVCVLNNVLEHVVDPAVLLSKLRNVLAPEGLVMAMIPNDFSRLQEKVVEMELTDREYWFNPPQHLHYFNVGNAERFANDCNYEVVDKFGDFPIEFFLFHPGSNYAKDPLAGKPAHLARVTLDLMLAEHGLEAYHSFCQALSACGVGRNVAMILRPKNS